jgi:hypothetical protein
MATPLNYKFDVPHTVSACFDTMSSEQFMLDVLEQTHSLHPQLVITPTVHGVTMDIQRSFVGDWPSFVAPLIGESLEIQEIRTWHYTPGADSASGTLELRVVGQPVTMAGTMTIQTASNGSRVEISASVTARIPFLGGKIEALVIEQIIDGIAAEAAILQSTSA